LNIKLKPIGIINSSITDRHDKDSWKSAISDIVLDVSLENTLDKLEEFSHVIVLYWLHKVVSADRTLEKVHPRGNKKSPLVGVLASRSPARPNPIGMATVRLLARDRNILKVQGLDALNGTPVLDIKPFIPNYDCPAKAITPRWIAKELTG
jgi:tRNA-Thr(GGU) m(6)t(6)A37 methyltransferase TsaA